MPILSPNTLMVCFATHDDTIKERIEAELSTQKQNSSGRKSHKVYTYSNGSTIKNYMNLKSKGTKSFYKKGNYNNL